MPLVAIVDGIRLMIYFKDHSPPHFHADLAEHRAKFDIETLKVVEGRLPKSLERKVIQWAESRRQRLLSAWLEVQDGQSPSRIK